MKTLDFSQPGRMPVTQDVLDYLQQANIEMFAALARAFMRVNDLPSATPVIIAGMEKFILEYDNGYFFYNGEIVQFIATSIPTIPNGKELAVVISETATPLTLPYYDSSTPSVKKVKTATLMLQDIGTPATTTQFAWSALKRTGEGLNYNNLDDAITTESIGFFGSLGTLNYRKNYLTNTVHLWGTLSISVSGLGTPPLPYYTSNTLPNSYRPSAKFPFFCFYRYHNITPPLDNTGKDYIRGINAEANTDGTVSFGPIAAASDYTVTFNTIIPLD